MSDKYERIQGRNHGFNSAQSDFRYEFRTIYSVSVIFTGRYEIAKCKIQIIIKKNICTCEGQSKHETEREQRSLE